MTLIRDLIELPDQVRRGDFVLRLTEGVTHPEATLRDYVVTEQLAACFDRALGLVKSAIDGRTSKAAYLHGSFGSGKSHFMAVLHLILEGNSAARSIKELAPVIAKHADWIEGKKFLLVPYHMIGARSMESAILGGYAEHVHRLHPDAPTPGVYPAEKLFENAEKLRSEMGDDKFFAMLNRDRKKGGGGWGKLEAEWDASRFGQALKAPARSEERVRLVGDLVGTVFTSFRGVAGGTDEAFVALDEGLAIVSRHARSLNYDAVILFLDELILWLASHAGDTNFLSREGQKLAKLVEAEHSDRPAPVVSFIARQRDLRELVGEHVPGAEQLSFADMLKYWEARFDRITLEDRNLPAIAERRVLKPRSEAARLEIDQAFRETEKVREEVMRTLLGSSSNREMFRKVYPFSPALVQALVALSEALQRERTALKVMLQLLVEQRDHLALGEIVPLGDLFDVIAEGDEPFTEVMRNQFENARKLFRQKLLPLLEREGGMRSEEIRKLDYSDSRAAAFRANDRIIKTLLLAALAPEVEALKALTPERLAALNHGSIRSPIAGTEGGQVLTRLRRWAAEVGEIKIGDESQNPTVTIQLSGVDTESIIESAKNVDNVGNRRRKLRELLLKELGVEDQDTLFLRHRFRWRGTTRECDLAFDRANDVALDRLKSKNEDWNIFIEVPFGDPPRTPADVMAKLDEFRADLGSTDTLVWIPAPFTLSAQRDIGTLVIIDFVLTGDQLERHSAHLSAQDRATAREVLRSRQSQLRARIKLYLEGAYGVAIPPPGSVDLSHELSEHVQSLHTGFEPKPPVGATLADALTNLLDQAMALKFPAHPEFPELVRMSDLRKVYGEIQRTAQERDGRVAIDRPMRGLMNAIAVPLRLGDMGETHFVLGHYWHDHFNRKTAADGGTLTVSKLRTWMDEPEVRGLTPEVRNLVILTYADQDNYSFFLHGGRVDAALDSLKDEWELRPVNLPEEADWKLALERAASIFGFVAPPLRTAANVERFAGEIRGRVEESRVACDAYRKALRARLDSLGIAAKGVDRAKTADAAQELVELLHSADSVSIVKQLAHGRIETTAQAMALSMKKAANLQAAIANPNVWEILSALPKLTDDRGNAAASITKRVRDAITADELAMGLENVLNEAHRDAVRLLTDVKKTPEPPRDKRPHGGGVVERATERNLELNAARAKFRELEGKLGASPSLRIDLDWAIHKEEEEK